jgi:hypothetical protein
MIWGEHHLATIPTETLVWMSFGRQNKDGGVDSRRLPTSVNATWAHQWMTNERVGVVCSVLGILLVFSLSPHCFVE